MATGTVLSSDQARDLETKGFLVIAGPLPRHDLELLSEAYDRAMRDADPADLSTGSTTIRVHDFVNRGAEFDRLYLHSPVLEASCLTLRQPFRLSSMLGRTLVGNSRAQALHVDYPPDENGWTMLGFIYMVDEFRGENGATCFVPGSHLPNSIPMDRGATVPACGPAGSVIIYNGSVLHGHGDNLTGQPRRSVQGAYIRRGANPATDFASRMRPETLSRIGPLARYLLGLMPGNLP
jgi:hypothetical protein